jgi:hypothetical protein
MPTSYRRIAVSEDPELAEALARASRLLPGRSDGALVKELALRGAGSLLADDNLEALGRILARTGAEPPRSNPNEILRANPPREVAVPSDPDPLTRALEEQREERL